MFPYSLGMSDLVKGGAAWSLNAKGGAPELCIRDKFWKVLKHIT